MASISDLFSLGWQRHEAGDFAQAESLYREVLRLNPGHINALCFLGAACEAQDKFDEAELHYREAIRLKPDYAAAHYNLGLTLDRAGRLPEAADSYQKALRFEPELLAASINLGTVLQTLGKLDDAIVCFQHVVNKQPEFAEVRLNLASALAEKGNVQAADARCQEAVALRPRDPEAHFRAGAILGKSGSHEHAIGFYQQALRLSPDHINARFNLSNSLQELGRLQEAVASYKDVLHRDANHVGSRCNLAKTLIALGHIDEAVNHLQQALRLSPDLIEAHINLAIALKCQGYVEEGLAPLEHVIRLYPNHVEARWNRALFWLLQGEFERGWADYELHWQRAGCDNRALSKPRWDGSALEGRRILLWSEQGLGDTIQFSRYAAMVKKRGGHVIFECQAALARLLRNLSGVDEFVLRGLPLPPFDVQAPLLSLPGIFRTAVATIPATTPYLQADAQGVEQWRTELKHIKGFKVGIAWQGNPEQVSDRQRSIVLAQFEAIAKVPSVSLISLQKGPGTEQLTAIADRFAVVDFGDRLDQAAGPFMDTAAIMKNLDLVISSDTSIPHLAGALGVPVWVALPLIPDWRWLLQRQDSPWYPTMRLFRQSKAGDWDEVFQRIAAALNHQVMSRK